ncbi:GDSL esterase/lipase At1g71250-like [Magnolia sinica]|uniref:GDSL esterase/lipase At1g71250-like n=1 Tax=Magnolia sinica TaxID=86752 RepID=UPI002657B60E|nr:GDSL esterase/lipase At1g71250-like [Magnolia sinica]
MATPSSSPTTIAFSYWFFTVCMFIYNSFGVVGSVQVPAMFVFGDSLVDNGNNNNLISLAKSNYLPYGIDFYQGPSGRFCNGRTTADMLCEMLKLPYLPAHADPNPRKRIISGVNYASAAGGILDETGQQLGERFSLSQQVLNFESNLNDLRNQMGPKNLTKYLATSITVMVFGSNDYINNYLLPSLYNSSYIYNPKDYADLLLNHYARQILALHSVGLRKFFLAGVGPLGCSPNQLAIYQVPPGRCANYVNEIVGPFNEGLRSLVDLLNSNHPGAIFVYGNTYGAFGDILNGPDTYGFNVTDESCCGVGRNQGQITCLPQSIPCGNRNEYIFWDAFHPTEAANAILAQRAFTGPPSDCYPINVQQMALI